MAPDVRPPEWGGPRPYPRRGPSALLPNPSTGGSEHSGTTEARDNHCPGLLEVIRMDLNTTVSAQHSCTGHSPPANDKETPCNQPENPDSDDALDRAVHANNPWSWSYFGETMADEINDVWDNTVGKVIDAGVEAIDSTATGHWLLQKTGEAVVSAQNAIDDFGASHFNNWWQMRDVVNFDNRYIRAGMAVTAVASAACGIKDAVLKGAARAAVSGVSTGTGLETGAAVQEAIVPEALRGTGKWSVYVGYDEAGIPKYVGRTTNFSARAKYWARTRGYRCVTQTDELTYNQARAIEDEMIRCNGIRGNSLDNLRYEIDMRLPHYQEWNAWAKSTLHQNNIRYDFRR